MKNVFIITSAVMVLLACQPAPEGGETQGDPRQETVVVANGVYKRCDGTRAVYSTAGSRSDVVVVEWAAECVPDEQPK